MPYDELNTIIPITTAKLFKTSQIKTTMTISTSVPVAATKPHETVQAIAVEEQVGYLHFLALLSSILKTAFTPIQDYTLQKQNNLRFLHTILTLYRNPKSEDFLLLCGKRSNFLLIKKH